MRQKPSSFRVRLHVGKIYVAGGEFVQSASRNVERYDPATNSWQQVAPMGTERIGPALCAI